MMKHLRLLVATVGLLGVLFLGACDSDSGDDGGADTIGGAGDTVGGVDVVNEADCETCVQQACPAELQTCESDPACQALLDCIGDCLDGDGGTGTCTESCVTDNPAGASGFEALSSCAATPCPSCGVEAPGTDLCLVCIGEECPNELQACKADPDCDLTLDCIIACPEDDADDCMNTCVESHPAASSLIEALGDCADAACVDCREGDDDLPELSFQGTLIVHPSDSLGGGNVVWGLMGSVTNASSATNGADNTEAITNALGEIGADYAAKLCGELDAFGYTDWYLPAREELDAIYQARDAVGGFGNQWYWSSTEDAEPEQTANRAWIQNFEDGFAHAIDKGLLGRVRCVRRPN